MQFGLQINPYHLGTTGNPWDQVAPIARLADSTGFDSLWLYDHFLYEGGYSGHPVSEPVMECFTTLGAIAAVTSRIRLGQLVLGIPYRNPAMMTKMATTLDLISKGRSILGIGAGWHQREYEGYGWGEFEPVGVRMKRLEEAIQVTLALWTTNPATFAGTYYRLDQVKENPSPVQRPHPPLLIGGSGEKVTLRLVAQYGQLCNVSGDPAAVQHLFSRLREHCDAVGRPYEAITRSFFCTVLIGRDAADVAAKRARWEAFVPARNSLIGTPAQLVAAFREYAAVGGQYAILRMPDWFEPSAVERFANEVIPALA